MTAPSRHSPSVTPKSQRSLSVRLGIASPLSRGDGARSRAGLLFRQFVHELLEDAAAMFVILKLIEAGAGGREQNNVAGLRGARGDFDGALDGAGAFD